MSVRLIACESCHRHGRITETTCPFCGAPMPTVVPVRGKPIGKFGRAALVIAAAAGATASGSSCSDGPVSVGDAYGMDVIGLADSYGMTFFDAHPDVSNDVTAGDAYGLPLDAGDASDAEPETGD